MTDCALTWFRLLVYLGKVKQQTGHPLLSVSLSLSIEVTEVCFNLITSSLKIVGDILMR